MKYVKIFLVASLALFGLASCGGDDAGVVGDATVEFYSDNLEGGFASDYLMVPIKLTDDEARTADVTLTVKAKEYTGAFAGVVDKDFMLTTENMVFKPGVDSINLEVMVLNKEVDELRFMLEISESNATTGQVKEMLVSLAKTDLDRICTTWEWNWTKTWKYTTGEEIPQDNTYVAAWAANNTCKVTWDPEYEELNLSNFEDWGSNYPLFADYDAKNNAIALAPMYLVVYASSAYDAVYAQFAATYTAEGQLMQVKEGLVGTPDETYSQIIFNEPTTHYSISKFSYPAGQLIGIYTYAYEGLSLTKPGVAAAPAAVPAKAAVNASAPVMQNKMDNIRIELTDYEKVKFTNLVMEALNAQMR